MTEEKKTTARNRYDAKRAAAMREAHKLQPQLLERIVILEDENVLLKARVADLEARIEALERR